ncbi:MAG: YbjQ family protein [Pseudomonadales bacterium]
MSINLIIFLTLVVLGYVFGRRAEKKHFESITARESEYKNLLTFSERFPPADMTVSESKLVGGAVVISIDYFKRLAAGLRSIFGGRVTAYESLIERARREAILRMKEDALAMGAEMIINVKLETSSITKGSGDQVGAVEVYAYGTALKH